MRTRRRQVLLETLEAAKADREASQHRPPPTWRQVRWAAFVGGFAGAVARDLVELAFRG